MTMKIIGDKKIRIYAPADEGPHAYGDQEGWQESVALVWWDVDNKVGGFSRIGHEPTFEGGKVLSWMNFFTPEWIFKQSEFLPLRAEDTAPDYFGGGGSCAFRTDGQITQWTFNAPEISADLKTERFHLPIDVFPPSDDSSFSKNTAANHFETGDRISGVLNVKGATYNINGLGHRDHSWGIRRWGTLLAHRWFVGVIDADFSFCVLTWHAIDGSIDSHGYVMRGDTVIYATEIDVVVYVNIDGFSHRGGHVRLTLANGEKLDFECAPYTKGIVSYHHGMSVLDTLCNVTCGDRTGFCCLETSNNAQRGTNKPMTVLQGVLEDGFTAAK